MHENLLGSVMTAHSLASAVVEVAMKTPLLAGLGAHSRQRSVGDEQGLQEWLSRVVRSDVVHGAAPRKNSAPCLILPSQRRQLTFSGCSAVSSVIHKPLWLDD